MGNQRQAMSIFTKARENLLAQENFLEEHQISRALFDTLASQLSDSIIECQVLLNQKGKFPDSADEEALMETEATEKGYKNMARMRYREISPEQRAADEHLESEEDESEEEDNDRPYMIGLGVLLVVVSASAFYSYFAKKD